MIMNYKILFATLPCLLSISSLKKEVKEEIEVYDKHIYQQSNLFNVNDFTFSIDNDGTFEGDFSLESKITTTPFYVDLLYIEDGETQKSYDRISIHKLITTSNKKYTYSFSLSFSKNIDIIDFEISFSMPILKNYLNIKFSIDNPLARVEISNEKKLFYKYEFKNYIGYNYYYLFKPTSFLNAQKRIFYYDYFSFNNFYIESNFDNAFDNAYFYIEPKYTHLLRIFNQFNSSYPLYKFLKLNHFHDLNRSFIMFKNIYYYNPLTNFMYLTNNGKYKEVQNRIYMPLKYYDIYKNFSIGLYLKSFSPKKYQIFYTYNMFFEKNYKKDYAVIYKDNFQITSDDTLENIKL